MTVTPALVWILVRRPVLAWEAVRALIAVRARGGITPSDEYLRWRTATAYGEADATQPAGDLLDYLHWRRNMRALRRQR